MSQTKNSTSLAYLFEVIRPKFPSEIFSNETIDSLLEISQHLPLLSFGCFECDLGKKQGRVDVNVSFCSKFQEHLLQIDQQKFNALINNKDVETRFNPVFEFLERWRQGESHLSHLLDQVWIVYDILNAGEREIYPWHYVMYTINPLTEDKQIRNQLIAKTLAEQNINYEHRSKYEQIFNSLPSNTFICALGFQTFRNFSGLRLYLTGFSHINQIYQFLEANNWPGNIKNLSSLLQEYASMSRHFSMSFDAGPELQGRIGIELTPKKSQIDEFVQKLVDQNYIHPEVHNAVTNWREEFSIPNVPNRWSWPHSFSKTPIKTKDLVVFQKHILYYKFIYEEGRPMCVKGYLYFDRIYQSD